MSMANIKLPPIFGLETSALKKHLK